MTVSSVAPVSATLPAAKSSQPSTAEESSIATPAATVSISAKATDLHKSSSGGGHHHHKSESSPSSAEATTTATTPAA